MNGLFSLNNSTMSPAKFVVEKFGPMMNACLKSGGKGVQVLSAEMRRDNKIACMAFLVNSLFFITVVHVLEKNYSKNSNSGGLQTHGTRQVYKRFNKTHC